MKPFGSLPFSTPMPTWRLAIIALGILAALGVTVLIIYQPVIGAGFQAQGQPGAMDMSLVERWTDPPALLPQRERAVATVTMAAPEPSAVRLDAAPAAAARRDLDWTGSAAVPPRQPMLARTGSMQIKVESLAAALARAESVAVRLGAIVASSTAAGREGDLSTAAVTFRVPEASWDQMLNGLARLGDVERLTTEAQDVGEEYVDIEAREANARRLEARLLTLLATRTGKLQDVLAAERELARVRETLELLEGRRRYLAASVARSTLRVEFVIASVASGIVEAGMFRRAAKDALASFLWLVAFVIRVSGVVLPLALIAVAGWAVYRRAAREEARKVLPLQRLNVS
jgi:hypothetical protein